MIKFFSKRGCGLCTMAKTRAKKYTNIEYIILEDSSPLIEKYDIQTVPTVIVNDQKYTTLKEIHDILKVEGK